MGVSEVAASLTFKALENILKGLQYPVQYASTQ